MKTKWLIIDAATNLFQVGILQENKFSSLQSSTTNTIKGLFNLIETIFDGYTFDKIIFCEGPGKLIGIRATLMFVRVFKVIHADSSIYSYNSLALAHSVQKNPVCVCKNHDEYYIYQNDKIRLINRKTLESIEKPIYYLETQWNEISDSILIPMPYRLENYANSLCKVIRLNETLETVYDPQNDYKRWKPLRHR